MKLCIGLMLALLTLPVYGREFAVDPNGGFSAIQTAIDQGEDGDQIILAPGVYTGTTIQSIQMLGKSLLLRSQDPNDAAVVSATILQCASDGSESVPAVLFLAESEGTSILSGLTITGGTTDPALVCDSESQVVLDSCVIRDNLACGLYCYNTTLELTDCVFQHNQGDEGGAMSCLLSQVEMQDCVFIRNSASEQGGGICLEDTHLQGVRCQWIGNLAESGAGLYARSDSSLLVDNSMWVGNRAFQTGGGVMMTDWYSMELENCTLAGNVADYQGGSIAFGSYEWSMTNCIVAYNQDQEGVGRSMALMSSSSSGRRGRSTRGVDSDSLEEAVTISHCCLQLEPGETEAFVDSNDVITTDPMFVRIPNGGSDGWGDDSATFSIDESLNDDFGDLRLRVGSPCVDTGDSWTWSSLKGSDLDGWPRQMGLATDIGAYEFVQPTLKVTRPQGDEVWAAGSSQALTWSSVAAPGAVDILFSPDADQPWQTLATGITNSGAYLWDLPPDLESPGGQIRVTLTAPDPNQYIVDSAAFVVVPDQDGIETVSPWSTLAGNPQHTGQALFAGPLAPIEAWDINIPGELYTSVTLGYDDRLHVASENGVLYTFSSTGEPLWSVDVNSPLLTAPTVGPDGTVYVGAENGRLYALHYNGTLRWTWETEDFLYASAAVSDEGRIYVAAQNGVLYALSNKGSLLWSFQAPALNNSIPDAFLASPALGNNGEVLVGSLYEPRLYALAPEDGTVLWSCLCADANATSSSEKGSIFASPVVGTDGTLYQGLTEDPNLYAMDANNGTVLWTVDLCHAIDVELIGFGEYEYSFGGVPFANGVESGDSIWTEPALGPDGVLYVSMDDPYLRAVSPDGTLQWIVQLGTGGGFSLAVDASGMIYAAGDDGVLYVVNSSGQIFAEIPMGNSLIYPVIGSEGVLILNDVVHGLRVYHDLY